MNIDTPMGYSVRVYDPERCICDILKNPDSVDLEVYNKIINNYFRQRHRNLITLEKYAKELNVYEKLQNIMEVLI